MFGISFAKLLVLAAVIAIVWYGFKYIGRLQRIERGERRTSERSMGERLRKAARAEFDAARGPDYVYKSLLGDREPPLDYRK